MNLTQFGLSNIVGAWRGNAGFSNGIGRITPALLSRSRLTDPGVPLNLGVSDSAAAPKPNPGGSSLRMVHGSSFPSAVNPQLRRTLASCRSGGAPFGQAATRSADTGAASQGALVIADRRCP